jgi:peptide/nickel transport system permease protein
MISSISSTIIRLFRIKKFAIGLLILLVVLFIGIVGPAIYEVSPTRTIGRRYVPPGEKYPLGTDALGRDVLAQFLHGIRGSLYVGAIASAISLSLAIFLGTIAAVFGGLVDKIVMTLSEILLLIPSILLMMLLAAYLPERSLWIVAVVIGITSWAGWCRGFRSRTLSILSSEFINLAILSGASRLNIIIRDIVPIIAPYVLAAFAMLFSYSIMAEVGLTLVGVGMTKDVTLGLMLYVAQIYANISQGIWWTIVPPSITVTLIFLSLYMIATSIDELFSYR